MTRSLIVVAALAALFASPVSAQDKVTKATNWKAQAEHGGYYQAVATGIYAKYGLDVTIRQGGPNVDNNLLMLAGRIDFNMGGNSDSVFAFAEKNIPFRAVAAIFQKDPQILMSHPGVGNDSLAALKGVSQWQVYFWRGTGPWSNAQSSAGTSTTLPSSVTNGTTGAVGAQG